ncbi:MAG: FapA family protein [Candidatus Zixiibacteriota bacterium]
MTPDTTQIGAKQRCRVTASKDLMTAMMVVFPPEGNSPDPTVEELLAELGAAGVTFGIDRDAIEQCLADHVYNEPIKAAVGKLPVKGENAQFIYHFDTTGHHAPQQGEDGRIDYRNMRYIQNAEPGTALVSKKPPTTGEPGTNVYGKEVAAAPGRDFALKAGMNTRVSEDGLSVVASAPGAIVFANGEVSVKDVLTINGDVDISVGNLDCRGSVHVRGHIKAGFNITVDGHLEVDGTVEDSVIRAKGNVLVRGGFFGNGSGEMHADGDITVKFAEGQKLIAGGSLIVGGELINCQVTVRENVQVKGKKGKIIGGDIRAGKEIRASELGSEKGTVTNLRVAYDARLIQEYQETSKEAARLKADSERIKEALYALLRLQLDGKPPPDKKEAMEKLRQFQKDLPKNIEALAVRKKEIENKLRELHDARIIAEDRLYGGVKAYFGIVYREIMEEYRTCKLTSDGSQISLTDFKGN